MPVQINEIIVKAVVDSQPSMASNNIPVTYSANAESELEMIEKILEIIKEKQER